jgi:hypothetical protein
VNFSEARLVLGVGTSAFTVADTVGFGIKTQFRIPLLIEADKDVCLESSGNSLTSGRLCTKFGADVPSSVQTLTRPDGKRYVILGNGYYQVPTVLTPQGWTYETRDAYSDNNITLFKAGTRTYWPDNKPLSNVISGRQIGDDGHISLFHYSQNGHLPIELATLDVRVSGAMAGTTSSTLSRSMENYLKGRNVVADFLAGFRWYISNTTVANVNTNTTTGTRPQAANTVSLGAKAAPAGGLIVNGLTGLENYKLNGNPNVYTVAGDVIMKCNPPNTITSTHLDGVKTLVIEGGDLIIECNNQYAPNDIYSSWAFVVKGGDVVVSHAVTSMVGVYVAIPDGTTGGKFVSKEGGTTRNVLSVNGSLYGDAGDLFTARNYIRGTNTYDMLTTGVILSYSNRALSNPPPLLSQYLSNYSVTRVVR